MSLVPALTGTAGTLPLPNTAPTPAAGEPVLAEQIQELGQALLSQDATLEARKLSLAGGTMTGGLTLASSSSALVAPSGSTITAQNGSLFVVAKTRIRIPESMTDANHNLDINSNNNRIIMRTPPAGNRILTLLKASASPAPVVGDWFEVTALLASSAFTIALQREGSLDYVGVIGDGVGTSPYGSSNQAGSLLVIYDGSNWRLASVGGVAFFGIDA